MTTKLDINWSELSDPPVMPEQPEPSLVHSLPRMLRILGGGAIVAALSSFLFQEWDQGNDLYRYLMLLAATLGLATAGFASVRLLHEPKGARTFLGLSVTAVPINFGILAALLYSVVSWDGTLAQLPDIATWRTTDLAAVFALAITAIPLLALGAHIGYLVFARTTARLLTVGFLLGNALLLLPTRSESIIAPLVLGGFLLATLIGRHVSAGRSALHTFEGRLARASLFIPPALMLGRALWLYSPDSLLAVCAAFGMIWMLRALSLELPAQSRLRQMLEAIGLLAIPVAALGLADLVAPASGNAPALIAVIAFGALLWEVSTRSPRGDLYRRAASAATSLGLLAILIIDTNLLTTLSTIMTGVIIAGLGILHRHRSLFTLGAISAVGGLVALTYLAVQAFNFGHWGLLIAAGSIAILGASLLERHGNMARRRLEAWRDHYGAWGR